MATNIVGAPSQYQPGLQQQITTVDGGARTQLGAQLRNGTLVSGTVLNVTKDGGYLVHIQNGTGFSQNVTARATLPLIVGQNFRAIWDNSGETPVLRLSEKDFALLSKFAEGGEQEIASALLTRGMPMTGEMMNYIRMNWRKAGETPEKLGAILELLGRDLPMTPGNMQILSWYMSLDKKNLAQIWNKVRGAFREKIKNGDDPASALKNLMDGDDEIADFLKGHSMLSKPLKQGIDPNAMAAAAWAVGDENDPLMAKIWVSTDNSSTQKAWWQVGFELDGDSLDTITGEVESDSLSYIVALRAEDEGAYQTLKLRRDALRRELDDIPMSLQYISVNKGKRTLRTTPNRSIDIKI